MFRLFFTLSLYFQHPKLKDCSCKILLDKNMPISLLIDKRSTLKFLFDFSHWLLWLSFNSFPFQLFLNNASVQCIWICDLSLKRKILEYTLLTIHMIENKHLNKISVVKKANKIQQNCNTFKFLGTGGALHWVLEDLYNTQHLNWNGLSRWVAPE